MQQTNRAHAVFRALLAAVVLLTAFIWGHSAMPAAQSEGESLAVLPVIEPLLLWLGVPPALCHTALRKLAHFSEYGLLGIIWLALLLARRRAPWRSMLPAAGACLFTALVDETIQLFVPGRSGMVADIWIDFSGACTGILGACLLYQLIKHIRNKRQRLP